MNYIEETEKKIKELNTISELQDLLPALQVKRKELMEKMAVEDSKEVRDKIHDELFDIKNLQRDIKSKVMSIAHTKIRKPKF